MNIECFLNNELIIYSKNYKLHYDIKKIKSQENNVNINEILLRIINLIYEGMRRTNEHNYRD